jgi:predicted nucleic acid binding AN1-type Zn finger protein
MLNKCHICNKKTNNLGLICKCGNKFCMEHRLPENHNCDYDYKKNYRQQLLENLTSNKPPKYIEFL